MELAAHPDRNAEPRRRGLTQASPTRNHGAAKPASAISAALGVGVRLSLGDRCCLALAKREGRPVLTAERRWPLIAEAAGVVVELIR